MFCALQKCVPSQTQKRTNFWIKSTSIFGKLFDKDIWTHEYLCVRSCYIYFGNVKYVHMIKYLLKFARVYSLYYQCSFIYTIQSAWIYAFEFFVIRSYQKFQTFHESIYKYWGLLLGYIFCAVSKLNRKSLESEKFIARARGERSQSIWKYCSF